MKTPARRVQSLRLSSLALLLAASLGALLVAACGADPGTDSDASSADSQPPQVHPETWPEVETPLELDADVEAEIGELIARMSTAEKVGQIIQSEIRHTTPEDVRQYHLGSVLNGGGSHPGGDPQSAPEDWLALADAYWDAAADDSDGAVTVPILWGVDAVHGHNNVIGATLFPHNVALGATRDAGLVEEIGSATAKEIIVTGLDWNFSPTVAVARDLRWGRAYESYSQDPAVVAELGAAYVRGVQGEVGGEGDDAFLGEGHVISTAKHFIGDGGTTQGIDQGNTEVSEEVLRDVHGAGYVTALEAGVQAVMASFSSWHGKKLHGHEGLLTDVLKERMDFDGFVVGDWNGHGQVATCTNESCAPAFVAGIDMFMVPEDWKALYETTLAQVDAGEIPMERLDDAVRRILRVKHRYGLFDPERRGVRPSERAFAGQTELLGSAAHRDVARRAVRQSLVLLKNAATEGGDAVLPLAPGSDVLVAGDGADDIGKQAGGWTISWQGTGNENDDFPGATSIWDGLKSAIETAGGSATLSVDGAYESVPDVAVVVFGEDPYAEFQGDRLSVQYSSQDGSDLELLQSFRAEGIPVVAVFLTGRPLWVNPHLNASDAFVVAWLPGSEGVGVADVLVAGADGAPRHDFTGRLPFAWPRSVLDAQPAKVDDPLFALGYGLSYGDDGSLAELSEEVEADAGRLDSHTYFRGGPVAPWRLETSGDGLTVEAVDRTVQEDARRIAWTGEGTAAVELTAEQTVDLRREANGGLSLAFDVLVESAPSDDANVTLQTVGTVGVPGAVPLGDVLRAHADGEWHRVRIGLGCLADAGADLARVHTPWRLESDGALILRVSEIKLDTAGDGESLCPPADNTATDNAATDNAATDGES